jgi:hypothetical protein
MGFEQRPASLAAAIAKKIKTAIIIIITTLTFPQSKDCSIQSYKRILCQSTQAWVTQFEEIKRQVWTE